jgi:hypothetical protein
MSRVPEQLDDDEMIGYAAIARLVNSMSDAVVSRQGVWQWWNRRARNGFPEGVLTPSGSGRTSHRVFRTGDITAWWKTQRPGKADAGG